MKTSNETAELFTALAKVGGQLKNPKKSATAKAGSYSYGYAPLDQMSEDTRATLGDQGMSCIQELLTEPGHGYVGVITRLTHASGQWFELGPFWLPLAMVRRARVGDDLRPALRPVGGAIAGG